MDRAVCVGLVVVGLWFAEPVHAVGSADGASAVPEGAATETGAKEIVLEDGQAADAAGRHTGWPTRVVELSQKLDEGLVGTVRADQLFEELASELRKRQVELLDTLRARSPDALDLRAEIAEVYSARLRMLDLISPSLRSRLTRLGPDGIRALSIEFGHARLDFLFQALAIPRGVKRLGEDLRASPMIVVWGFVELTFGVVVFRTWRRWARKGLPDARRKVLSVRPRTDVHLNVARALWYLDRFRPPLEWLALLSFVSALYEPGDLLEVASLVRIILLWTLLTWFGLLLVDAIASRAGEGPAARSPGLRRRSLRLVAAWILLTGLGLDLVARYVGEAVIHTWAIRAFACLLIPIGGLLLVAWRGDILQRVQEDASFSTTARRIGRQKKGLHGYLNAIAGIVYIMGAELLQFSIRVFSRFEGGRRVMATLLRREIESDAQREHAAEKPISEELVFALLTPGETVIDGPYRAGLEQLEAFAATESGGTVAVLAERGGGLNTFLRVLQGEIGESMRIIDCPPGGVEKFDEALANAFGLEPDDDLQERLRPAMDEAGVRVIGICNFHRLARPQMGGLAGIDRATSIARAIGEDILWILGVTRAAWPYISLVRGDRAVVQDVVALPPWSEEQLEELFDARCEQAEIEPDYRRLSFPRQFDDGEKETLEERNRFGLHRVLWELSDGNPEVAIRLYTSCLRELPSGKIIVRLPQTSSSDRIAASNLAIMLILKVLVETELATLDDLVASTREPRDTVQNCLAHCLQEGWVEQVYDHYQITWSFYRRVKRVLVRRGLVPR